MGLVHAEIRLINSNDIALFDAGYIEEGKVRKIEVTALVNSGAYMLAINETVKTQLGLKVVEERPAELADGSVIDLEVVGPVEVQFKNRRTVTEAMVLPGDAEILLGAIPMEGMDVLIDPKKQELIVNPKHPMRPQMSLK
jgi:clan AA aspartic protease